MLEVVVVEVVMIVVVEIVIDVPIFLDLGHGQCQLEMNKTWLSTGSQLKLTHPRCIRLLVD